MKYYESLGMVNVEHIGCRNQYDNNLEAPYYLEEGSALDWAINCVLNDTQLEGVFEYCSLKKDENITLPARRFTINELVGLAETGCIYLRKENAHFWLEEEEDGLLPLEEE